MLLALYLRYIRRYTLAYAQQLALKLSPVVVGKIFFQLPQPVVVENLKKNKPYFHTVTTGGGKEYNNVINISLFPMTTSKTTKKKAEVTKFKLLR